MHDVLGAGKRMLDEPGRALVANSTVTLYTVQSVKRNVSTWVAVDGGMSDNLRPMLYGARYEAHIADRFGTGGTRVPPRRQALRVRRRDRRATPSWPTRRSATWSSRPATGAYGYAMANNYNGVPRPPVIFCRDGDARLVVRRETLRGPASRAMSAADSVFRIGLLGHGTVGARVRGAARPARRPRSRRSTGLRPEISGVLTRSQGDFERDPRAPAT